MRNARDGVKHLLRAVLVAALVLGVSFSVTAQSEVVLVTPLGMKPSLDELLPRLEKKTGQKVKTVYGSVGATRKQVLSSDPFDVAVVMIPDADLLASGKLVAGSATPIANVSVGVAVKHGAPKPDIATPEAVKRTLLAAKSLSFSDPAGGSAAGVSFTETLKKLGIQDQVRSKIQLSKAGVNSLAAVAKGDAELGLIFMSEMDEPGVDAVGPLPKAISPPIRFVGFVSPHAKDPAAAKALLEFLSAPEAGPSYKSHAMEPSH
jgi:molybdate transport system substrate-binding protein